MILGDIEEEVYFECDSEDVGRASRGCGSREGGHASRLKKWRQGFTLIEMVVVIVLLGIMSAVVVPKVMDNTFSQYGYAGDIGTLLRHARNTAIASRRYECVNISAAGIDLTRDKNTLETVSTGPVNCSQTVTFPGADSSSCGHQLCPPGGVSASVTTGSNPLIFDSRGRLVDSANVLNAAGTAVSISVTGGWTITVQPETGYVQ